MTRWGKVALVAVAIIAAAGWFWLRRESSGAGVDAQSVRVAMNLPLTGPFGVYGQSIRDGALLAVSELGENGNNLRLDIEDNAGATNTAITVFQKQSLEKIDVYVSGVKPQTMAIFDRATAAGFPYFVWVFDAFIVERNPTVFRTWVNYKYEAEKYLQYARARKAKHVAIACVNLPHALEEFNDIVIPQLKKEGIDASIEIFDLDSRQHRDVILKLASGKPDLYILNGFQEDLVAFARALRTLNLFSDGNAIGTYDLLDAAKILGGSELEGFRVVAPEFIVQDTPAFRAWSGRFKQKYGREPLYTDAYSYDMISVIADATRRLSAPATSSQWLEAIRRTDAPGVTGRLRFDEGGDLVLALKVGVYRNGALAVDSSEAAQ
ncbi:MAG: ABC transporter substrate-binding protein [Vicinamibacterales bacterium]